MFRKMRAQSSMIGVLVAASLGLIASLVLSHEALILAANKSAVLSCSLNAVVNCATVANHWSASLMGFPNSFFGLMTFPVVMTIAVVILSGVKLPTWIMRASQIGVSLGLIFAGWMLYMSLVVIRVMCPWCLATDLAMLIIFFGVTRYNVLNKNCFNQKLNKKMLPFFEKSYDQVVMWLVVVAIILIIIGKYGAEIFV